MTEPVFSIIIPTRRRSDRLSVLLEALASLEYPRTDYEVIVVQDGEEMPIDAVVRPFKGRLDVTAIAQPHAGPATARNTGAARAKGRFLVFTDDDCVPSRQWLQEFAAHFACQATVAAGGQTFNALPANSYSAVSALLISYLYAYYNVDPSRARFFTSNNLAMPAAEFRRIGAFDTTFPWAAAEDRELCDRWLRGGYEMSYLPAAVIEHRHQLAFQTFCRQHFTYGRGAYLFHCARGRAINLEPLRFYVDLLRYPWRQEERTRALRSTALLVVSQVANALGFVVEQVNQTCRQILREEGDSPGLAAKDPT